MSLLDFELLAHNARAAAPVKSKALYPRGTEPGPAPWRPPVSQGAHANTREAAAKFYERPRCLECMSVVIVNLEPRVWNCSNLACGRGGWVETILGRAVRVVDKGVTV